MHLVWRKQSEEKSKKKNAFRVKTITHTIYNRFFFLSFCWCCYYCTLRSEQKCSIKSDNCLFKSFYALHFLWKFTLKLCILMVLMKWKESSKCVRVMLLALLLAWLCSYILFCFVVFQCLKTNIIWIRWTNHLESAIDHIVLLTWKFEKILLFLSTEMPYEMQKKKFKYKIHRESIRRQIKIVAGSITKSNGKQSIRFHVWLWSRNCNPNISFENRMYQSITSLLIHRETTQFKIRFISRMFDS